MKTLKKANVIKMNIKDQIKEYLNEWEDYVIGGDINDELASDIEKIIKENYFEKEFVEYTQTEHWQYHARFKVWKWYSLTTVMTKTTDELYDYWLKKIKK